MPKLKMHYLKKIEKSLSVWFATGTLVPNLLASCGWGLCPQTLIIQASGLYRKSTLEKFCCFW